MKQSDGQVKPSGAERRISGYSSFQKFKRKVILREVQQGSSAGGKQRGFRGGGLQFAKDIQTLGSISFCQQFPSQSELPLRIAGIRGDISPKILQVTCAPVGRRKTQILDQTGLRSTSLIHRPGLL